MPQEQQRPYVRLFWNVKALVEKIPGAFEVYKFITSRTGEGKVYEIKQGPLQGIRWKRYNILPYWYHLGLYEPQLSEYTARYLPTGGTFWDIGANAGYHAIMATRATGPQGQVIAVEPDPHICDIFREQLSLNNINNCTVIQAAVSNKEGVVTFVKSGRDTRSSALQGMMPIHGKTMDVPAVTLDGLAKLYPAPYMLKMDIEGAEIVALPGGETLFSGKDRPKHVLLAVHGSAAKAFCTQFLKNHGYTLVHEPGFDEDVTLVAVAP